MPEVNFSYAVLIIANLCPEDSLGALAVRGVIPQTFVNVTTSPANLTDIVSSELATAKASATLNPQATLGYTFSGFTALIPRASTVISPTFSAATYGTTPHSGHGLSTSFPVEFTAGAWREEPLYTSAGHLQDSC